VTVSFELDGQPFTALNGGPHFKFTEAISLQVMCETQAEIDRKAMLQMKKLDIAKLEQAYKA
jgi:predicted 3-demethylubiquinone-9 3-methyltransferase (glyoxalase superfamily)